MSQLAFAVALSLLSAVDRAPAEGWETRGPENSLIDALVAGLEDDTVYAGARDPGTGRSALFRSDDGGNQWTLMAQAPEGETIVRLAIDPTDRHRMMALTAHSEGGTVYRSDDAGFSWRADLRLASPRIPDASIFFDPAQADTAFVVWSSLWESRGSGPWGDVSGFGDVGGAWVAPDGALLWSVHRCDHIPCYPQFEIYEIVARIDSRYLTFPSPCLRLQTVAYEPSDASVAYGAGWDCAVLLRSRDGGRTWDPWDPSADLDRLLNEGVARRFAQLDFDRSSGSTLYGLAASLGLPDSGEVLRSRDVGNSWELVDSPDGLPVYAMTVTRSGSLYVGTPKGVFRRTPHTRPVAPRLE